MAKTYVLLSKKFDTAGKLAKFESEIKNSDKLSSVAKKHGLKYITVYAYAVRKKLLKQKKRLVKDSNNLQAKVTKLLAKFESLEKEINKLKKNLAKPKAKAMKLVG